MIDESYILNHLGEERETYFGAGTPPVVQTSNFIFETVEEMAACMDHEDEQPFYTRGVNPTTTILCKKMAALEQTEEALAFASGSAAIAAAILAHVQQGDHIVCVRDPYSWTNKLLKNWLPRFGVDTTFVDGTDPENFLHSIKKETKILYLESPNSWTFELQDVKAIAGLAKERGLSVIMDNSYATPINLKPATLGVDVVLHSATKYISGHSDTVGGILCASKATCRRIFAGEFMTLGGIISPLNAWLLIRGLRTLEIRMDRVAHTTAQIIAFLEKHPAVEQLNYPFSASHPQYSLATRQMRQGTGQFSVKFKAKNQDSMAAFCNALRYFKLACSWGGHESLAFPALTLHQSLNYTQTTLPVNLVRFYAGLESPELLVADLENALHALKE